MRSNIYCCSTLYPPDREYNPSLVSDVSIKIVIYYRREWYSLPYVAPKQEKMDCPACVCSAMAISNFERFIFEKESRYSFDRTINSHRSGVLGTTVFEIGLESWVHFASSAKRRLSKNCFKPNLNTQNICQIENKRLTLPQISTRSKTRFVSYLVGGASVPGIIATRVLCLY